MNSAEDAAHEQSLTDDDDSSYEQIDDLNYLQSSDEEDVNDGENDIDQSVGLKERPAPPKPNYQKRLITYAGSLPVLLVAISTTYFLLFGSIYPLSSPHASHTNSQCTPQAETVCDKAIGEVQQCDCPCAERTLWIEPNYHGKRHMFEIRHSFISWVQDSSNAQKSGLEEGDQIMSVNGINVEKMDDRAIRLLIFEEDGIDGSLPSEYIPLDETGFNIVVRRNYAAMRRAIAAANKHYARGVEESQSWEKMVIALLAIAFCVCSGKVMILQDQLDKIRKIEDVPKAKKVTITKTRKETIRQAEDVHKFKRGIKKSKKERIHQEEPNDAKAEPEKRDDQQSLQLAPLLNMDEPEHEHDDTEMDEQNGMRDDNEAIF